jgi:hypothetical protein
MFFELLFYEIVMRADKKLKLMAFALSHLFFLFHCRAMLTINEDELYDSTLSCQINKFMKICFAGSVCRRLSTEDKWREMFF